MRDKKALTPHEKKINKAIEYSWEKLRGVVNEEKPADLEISGGHAGDAAAAAAMLRTKACGQGSAVLEMISLLDAYVGAYSLDDGPVVPDGGASNELRLHIVYRDPDDTAPVKRG